MPDRVLMPDGTPFGFWDDRTEYTRVYHVACGRPNASDDNRGTSRRPLATIGRAAELLRPGQKAVIHGGVYRECVRPARGGTGPDAMVAYEAAPGESVIVRGSRVWSGPFRRSEGPKALAESAAPVWMGDLPAEWFAGYNPFVATNMTCHYTTFVKDWTREETQRLQLRRGMLFADGVPLRQVFRSRDLAARDGAFWVEEPGQRIHFRLRGDADPAGATVEAAVQEQCFAPAERHLGYVRVSGIVFEHAADGVPVPQRAMVSTSRGHHWIVEDCTLRHANSTGLDVGKQDWDNARREPCGAHVVRRNRISDCGACGVAGTDCVDGTLFEDNTIERIGGLDIERIWETAGLKLHLARGVLFRRNVFRHIRGAPGLWIDCSNANCRITANVFADIETLQGACFIEMTFEPNLVDGNVFWDIRRAPWPAPGGLPAGAISGGLGVHVDSGDNCTVAHNLFAHIRDNFAVAAHLTQAARVHDGRVGLCRRHKVLNNVFVACPKRIHFGRAEENASDGNCFDTAHDAASFCVFYPAPAQTVNLAAWRDYLGFDRQSAAAKIEARFDPDTLELSWEIEGDLPRRWHVPALHGQGPYKAVGPRPADLPRAHGAGRPAQPT